MEDNIGLFKILVVVLVVGYQIVKALQKKAAGTATPGPVATEQSQDPPPQPTTSPWGQESPQRQAQTETMRERIRTLVLGRAEAPSPVPVAAVVRPPEAPPALEAPTAALSGSRANVPLVVPQIRELLLSQVVLGRPLGLRGLGLTRRSPADLRP